MGEINSDIPVLKPGLKIAAPGEPQPEIDEAGRKLYNDSLPKTVQILTDSGVGSGFFIDKDGKIGTAAHVILGSREHFAITADGTRYKLKIEKLDDINDTAIMAPIGLKAGSRPHVDFAEPKSLKADDLLFALGHPGGLRPAYISPGYFRKDLSHLDLMKDMQPGVEEAVQAGLESLTPKEQVLMKEALKRDLVNSKIHIRPGDSGGPLFNAEGKLVGINDMITSFENGYFVPVEKLKNLYESKDSEFQFTYNRIASPWAQEYKNTWQQKPLLAATSTLAAGGAGYLAYEGMSRFPKSLGLAASAYGGLKLVEDAGNFLSSTDSLDKLKYGVASVFDLSGTLGGLAFMSSRMRLPGTIGLAAGLGGRIAAEFIPTRLVLSDLKRKSDPVMPPFDPQIDRTLGLGR